MQFSFGDHLHIRKKKAIFLFTVFFFVMNIESELRKFLKMLSHFQEHFTAYPDQKILGHFFKTQCFSRANPFVNV